MKETMYKEQFATYYIRHLEHSKDQKEIQYFFQLQEELMNDIIDGNIDKAENIMQQLQDILQVRAPQELQISLPRFYLSLVVLFTNELKKFGLSPVKIFCFSSASIEVIYSWKSVDELMNGGKWLVRSLAEMVHERINPLYKHPIVSHAVELINRKLEDPIEVEAIAKELEVSPSYLAKLFKQEVGMTVKQFSNNRKVAEAKYYLQYSNREIADISDQFSFCNQSYFTKVFKEQMGMTPKQYRLSVHREARRMANRVS